MQIYNTEFKRQFFTAHNKNCSKTVIKRYSSREAKLQFLYTLNITVFIFIFFWCEDGHTENQCHGIRVIEYNYLVQVKLIFSENAAILIVFNLLTI